ncbi:MAG: 30S ribosomal protein S1 [Clostridia bacterium]|nr:30S ribosomal protein S1 [Clostridia bacterium]
MRSKEVVGSMDVIETAGDSQGDREKEEIRQDTGLEIPALRPGDLVRGTVVQVGADQLLVDVGYKTDGVVPLNEMGLKGEQRPEDVFDVGQEVAVVVTHLDQQEGTLTLSVRRAREREAWRRLDEAYREGAIIEAPVTEVVKGGLVLDVGTRGFMPASHVERGYVSDLTVYVGQTLRCRVIELDRAKNRVILSRKVVLEEERQRLREKTWAELEEGQVRTGVVKGLTDFGAFIDLGGVDGLLHVSEMSWDRVNHPSDVLSVGDEVQVKVLRLDREKEKISLGLKQVLPDPWEHVETKYPVGSVHEGKVMRIASFGAFVQLEPGVEGLVHISQLADHHVVDPHEVISEGDVVQVKVLRVMPEERKISLSIREANRPARERQRERDRDRERNGRQGYQSSPGRETVTLGEMFGDLLEETRERLERRDS